MAKGDSRARSKAGPKKPASFDERLIMFLNVLMRMVKEQRLRKAGAAAKFGVDGMHVLLVETVDTAMKLGPNGYLGAATYALAAAMMSAGHWDDPKPPEPQAKKPRRKQKIEEEPTK